MEKALENRENKKINVKILKDRVVATDNGIGMTEEETNASTFIFLQLLKIRLRIGLLGKDGKLNGEIIMNSKKGHGTKISIILKKKKKWVWGCKMAGVFNSRWRRDEKYIKRYTWTWKNMMLSSGNIEVMQWIFILRKECEYFNNFHYKMEDETGEELLKAKFFILI